MSLKILCINSIICNNIDYSILPDELKDYIEKRIILYKNIEMIQKYLNFEKYDDYIQYNKIENIYFGYYYELKFKSKYINYIDYYENKFKSKYIFMENDILEKIYNKLDSKKNSIIHRKSNLVMDISKYKSHMNFDLYLSKYNIDIDHELIEYLKSNRIYLNIDKLEYYYLNYADLSELYLNLSE